MTDTEKCLKCICELDAAISNHPYTYPCTLIARIVKMPVKKVREIMKRLEEKGYVIRNHEGGYDDWNEKLYCIHGYSVTRQGRECKYWVEADKREREYIQNQLDAEFAEARRQGL